MKKRVAILMLAATFIFTGGQTWAAGQNAGAYYVDAVTGTVTSES